MCFVGLVTLRHAGEAAGPGPVPTAQDSGLMLGASRKGALMVCIVLLLDKL